MHRVATVLMGSLFFGSVAWAYPLQPPEAPKYEVRREVEYGGPVLGVLATELTPELQAFFGTDDLGVLISRVYDDTAAADAGIEVGDILVSVDGNPIATIWELRAAVDQAAGEDVIVEVVRDGDLLALGAELADMAPAWEPLALEVPEIQVVPDEDFERYVRPFAFERDEDVWRIREEQDPRFERLERHLAEVHEKMISEITEIQDRLDALEEHDFERPEVK